MHPGTRQGFRNDLYYSLISSTSALFSLAVSIRRSWASVPFARLSFGDFTSHPSTFGALSKTLGRSRSQKHGRHIFRPYPCMSGAWVGGGCALLGFVCRVTTPPASMIPARARAATRDMVISLAPVAPSNLCILPNAAVYPCGPQLSESEQTLGVHLGQPDHHSLCTTEALVQPAGTPEVGLGQRNKERSNNFLPCHDLVVVPDFEGPLPDQRLNFSLSLPIVVI